jgi:hypothetical protein
MAIIRKWITTVPERPVVPPRNIPEDQIGRVAAVLLFRAASGLGINEAKQLIDANFPRYAQPADSTLRMFQFRDFVTAWREANLRAFV